MKFDKKFLHSKIGRRIFSMLVCFVLIPLIVLSAVTLHRINRHIEENERLKLQQDTKSVGLSIYDRLQALENELQLVASILSDEINSKPKMLYDLIGQIKDKRFTALAHFRTAGDARWLIGKTENVPQPSAAEGHYLESGKSVVLVGHQADEFSKHIYLACLVKASLPQAGWLIGEINPAFLWGVGYENMMPHMTEFCVLDQSGNPLIYSSAMPVDKVKTALLAQKNIVSGNLEIESDDHELTAGFWRLFLKPKFYVTEWTLVIGRPYSDLQGPLKEFNRNFVLVLLVSFWIVLLLGIVFIKRSLVPLLELKKAASLITEGDFTYCATVSGDDEFSELASTFKLMSNRLGSQFKELKTIAAIGQSSATALVSVDRLAGDIMAILQSHLNFDRGAIMLFEKNSADLRYAAGFGFEDEQLDLLARKTIPIDDPISKFHFVLAAVYRKPILFEDVSKSKEFFPVAAAKSTEKWGVQSFAGAPISYENEFLGLIHVESTNPNRPLTKSDLHFIIGIAFQIAAAIYTARSYKQLQEKDRELLHYNATLEDRINERTAELSELNRKLSAEIIEHRHTSEKLKHAQKSADAANHAKSEFLANMSHELRTPLNHVIGFSEILVDNKLGRLDDSQQKYLNYILQSGRHLLSLVNDILDLSKVEAGKMQLDAESVDLRQVMESLLVLTKEKAAKHGIKTSLDIGTIPDTITADSRKLKQIIYNLLSNALKFTPNGGNIRISAKSTEASSGNGDGKLSTKDGQFIHITIEDEGIGLAQEDLERIFQPFEQTEGAAKIEEKGTGLGLSLSKRLVDLHGGRIWAESDGPNKGSRFTFTLPVRPTAL